MGYKEKKKKKAHRRYASTSHISKLDNLNNEMYVVAIKKRNHSRKQSTDVMDFLNEFEIKQQQNSNINFIKAKILEQTANFTMIQLSNEQIVYAVTAKVEKWTNNDVISWLNSISNGMFKKFIPKFKQRKTNGYDLMNLSRVQLQNNICMHSPTLRNRLLKEIKLLKIATKPSSKLSKKRSSAISFSDIKKIKK